MANIDQLKKNVHYQEFYVYLELEVSLFVYRRVILLRVHSIIYLRKYKSIGHLLHNIILYYVYYTIHIIIMIIKS